MLPVQAVQKLLCNKVEGTADGCIGQLGERDSAVAVPGKLGIERDGSETRDLQAGVPAASIQGIG
jgi:hypothetical protein